MGHCSFAGRSWPIRFRIVSDDEWNADDGADPASVVATWSTYWSCAERSSRPRGEQDSEVASSPRSRRTPGRSAPPLRKGPSSAATRRLLRSRGSTPARTPGRCRRGCLPGRAGRARRREPATTLRPATIPAIREAGSRRDRPRRGSRAGLRPPSAACGGGKANDRSNARRSSAALRLDHRVSLIPHPPRRAAPSDRAASSVSREKPPPNSRSREASSRASRINACPSSRCARRGVARALRHDPQVKVGHRKAGIEIDRGLVVLDGAGRHRRHVRGRVP